MGYDTLSIISMNSSRKGMNSMARCDQSSYLQQLLGNAKPDICLLPGDNNEKDNCVIGYGAYMAPGNQDTVMLYDTKRVTMTKQSVQVDASGLPGLDMNKIVCPFVEVKSPAPLNTIVKRLTIVTWHYSLPTMCGIRQEELMKSIVIYSQRIAMTTGEPILIGGEMNVANLQNIVRELNNRAQEAFLGAVQPEMAQMGYTPRIAKSALKTNRDIFKMQVIGCKPTQPLKESHSSRHETGLDCFIASKDLELTDATPVEVEKVLGNKVMMKPLTEHCPTRTEVRIPVRPPKHVGG